MSSKNILLIGFMGSGKTTVSRELAKITGRKEVDMDAYIVNKQGCSINEIFEKHGEPYFRDLETVCISEIQKNSNLIVSCGGGAVLKEENVKIMKKNGIIVLLTATPETIYHRVKKSKDRPLLNGNMNVEYIEELMNKRKAIYQSVADVVVSTDNKSIKEIAEEILDTCDKM